MAGPANPNQFDPDRIDISLDLVGAGSLEAVQQLTEQLRTVNVFNATNQARSPEGMVQNAAALSQAYGRRSRSGVWEAGAHAYQSRPESSPAISDGAGRLSSMLGRYADRERDQYDHRFRMGMGGDVDPYSSLFSGRTGGVDQELMMGRGGPSAGASVPQSGLPVDDPLWRQALTANPVEWERSQEGIRLPPGGLSLNIQDKLRIASDFLAQRAERRYQSVAQSPEAQQYAQTRDTALSMGWNEDEFNQMASAEGVTPPDLSSVGALQGNAAALLRIGSEHAAQAQLVLGDARNAVSRAYNYAGGFQQAGVQAGYERAGQINIPGTNIGFTNPLDFFNSDSAAREGLRQRVDTFRLRLMGGIDGQQAQQIVGSLAGLGWTGQQGQNMAFDALSPLVQQGLDPAMTSESMDMAVRQGNASLSDFVATMNHLGDSAKASNLSLSEYQQGLMEFAQAATQVGATPLQGMQLGRNLTDTFGVAPQVAAGWLSNPMVQAGAMRQGILPNEMGLMGTNQTVTSLYTGINMAMQATQQFRNMPIRDPQTGHMISGQDRQLAQAASIMGMPVNEFRRLLRQQQTSVHAGRAQDLLTQYSREQQAGQQEIHARQQAGQHAPTSEGPVNPGDWVVTHAQAPGAVRMPDGRWAVKATVHGYGSKWSNDPHTGILPNSAVSNAQAELATQHMGQLHRELVAMAPATGKDRADYLKRLSDVEKESGQKRIRDLHGIIDDRAKIKMPDNTPTVYVKFRGAAAKYFEQDNKSSSKQSANAGGTSTAEAALTPQEAQNTMSDYFKQNIHAPSGNWADNG